MSYEGSEFYDNPQVFQTYQQHRQRPESANDTLEKPIIVNLVGNVRDANILDLGCGAAAVGPELLAKGAASYLGVDNSSNMVECAVRHLAGTAGRVVKADITSWTYPQNNFDIVLSRLTLHYIEDLDRVFQRVFHTLKLEGRFIFSVEHPVITSCDAAWQGVGLRQDWIVDHYFEVGRRITPWLGQHVVKYHRTVEDYFLALQHAGFVVDSLRESHPEPKWFTQEDTYKRRKRIPLFLFFAASKRDRSVTSPASAKAPLSP